MILFKLIVDEVLYLPDVPYDMRDDLRRYGCAVVPEYEDRAFHSGVRLW